MKKLLVFILCLVATVGVAGVTQYMHMVIAKKNVVSGPWAPSDVDGLFLWVKADAGVLESDLSAAEAGDVVTNWEDQSGNGNDLTNGQNNAFQTSPNRIVSDGATVQFFDDLPATENLTNTLMAAHKTTDGAWVFLSGHNTKFVGAADDASGSSPHSSITQVPAYYSNLVVIATADRNDLHDNWSINSTVVSTAKDWKDVDAGIDWEVFAYPGGGFSYVGDVYEILWYTNAITDADFTNAVDYLLGRWE